MAVPAMGQAVEVTVPAAPVMVATVVVTGRVVQATAGVTQATAQGSRVTAEVLPATANRVQTTMLARELTVWAGGGRTSRAQAPVPVMASVASSGAMAGEGQAMVKARTTRVPDPGRNTSASPRRPSRSSNDGCALWQESCIDGAHSSRNNAGWVSVFYVTHQAIASNTTHFVNEYPQAHPVD